LDPNSKAHKKLFATAKTVLAFPDFLHLFFNPSFLYLSTMKLFSAFVLVATPFLGMAAAADDGKSHRYLKRKSEDDPIMVTDIKVEFLSPNAVDYNPDEQNFLAKVLVDSYHKSHEGAIIELADAKFEGQTHIPFEHPSLLLDAPNTNDSNGDAGVAGVGLGMFWDSGSSRYFGRWKCRRCSALESLDALETFIATTKEEESESLSLEKKKKKEEHDIWEETLCNDLVNGDHEVFQSVESCSIDIDYAPATPPSMVAVEKRDDEPVFETEIILDMVSNNENEHTKEQREYLGSCMVNTFNDVYSTQIFKLVGVKFESEIHTPVPNGKNLRSGMSWYNNDLSFFGSGSCRRRRLCGASVLEELFAVEEVTNNAHDEEALLRMEKKRTDHDAWEHKMCKCVQSGFTDEEIQSCAIGFGPRYVALEAEA